MKKNDLAAGIILSVFSLIMFCLTYTIYPGTLKNDLLGSRFFPDLILFLLFFSAILLIRDGIIARKKNDSNMKTDKQENSYLKRGIMVIGLSVLFVFLFVPLGIIITIPLYLFAMMWVWGERKITRIIIITISTTVLVYLVFVQWFGVMMPLGIFRQ